MGYLRYVGLCSSSLQGREFQLTYTAVLSLPYAAYEMDTQEELEIKTQLKISASVCTHKHTHIHICMYACIVYVTPKSYAQIQFMQICMHTICLYIYIYTHIHTHVHIYMHIHTHTQYSRERYSCSNLVSL